MTLPNHAADMSALCSGFVKLLIVSMEWRLVGADSQWRGRRDDHFEMSSKRERHQPVHMVAHHLINQLGAITGHCDLLIEQTEQGTEYARRLTLIRAIAETAAKELVEIQREVEAKTRKSGSGLTRNQQQPTH